MARRNQGAAEAAAAAASEAARTLQARRQEKAEAPPVQVEQEVTPPIDRSRVEKLLSGRDSSQAMDEIIAKREPKEPEEVEDKKDAAPQVPAKETSGAEAAGADSPKVESATDVQVSVASPAVAAPEAPKMVKVKIDGEESEVSQSEVDEYGGVRAYQIAKAGENRLAKMGETLAEMKRQQAEAAEVSKKTTAPSVSDEQYITERIEKIRFGTPEEASRAQLEINARLNKPVDSQAIIAETMARMAHEQAVKKFDAEFSDIANNAILVRAVVAIRNERIQQLPKGTPVDWEKFYRTIGNEVRSAVGRQSQPTPQTGTGTPSQPSKEERKAATIVELPKSGARAELPKEEKELTPEEEKKQWIADSKKARGQS